LAMPLQLARRRRRHCWLVEHGVECFTEEHGEILSPSRNCAIVMNTGVHCDEQKVLSRHISHRERQERRRAASGNADGGAVMACVPSSMLGGFADKAESRAQRRQRMV
jgi:hypothetical protein